MAELVMFSGCIDQTGQKAIPSAEEPEKGYRDITASELKEMMSQEDIFLVDTHIPEQRHIKGTDEFIPFNEIEANLDKLPEDKNAKVVVYCRSGSMSAVASEKLVELGYTNVSNLLGGTIEWTKQGYEFEE
jgi:rhodanese-related sulfurtransferase